MKKSVIKINELAQAKHVKFLIGLEKQSSLAFQFVMASIWSEIRKTLKTEKLAKSDDDELKTGWTGDVPKIEINFGPMFEKAISKRLKALEWVFYGKLASKEAVKAAEDLGMTKKFVPGVVPSAYLQSVDSQRQHFVDVFKEKAPDIPKSLITATCERMKQSSEAWLQKLFAEVRARVTAILDMIAQEFNYNNVNQVLSEAHDLLPKLGADDAVEAASDEVKTKFSLKKMNDAIKEQQDNINRSWDNLSETEIGKASAMGTHQSLVEVYGSKDDEVRVAWITFEDEKVCSFCENASKNPDGTYKYYHLKDFKPTGYNYGKKKSDWVLAIPKAHIHCRCDLVFVPRGFEVDKGGTLRPKK